MRIYIANLGKYNEGELVGAWFTPPVDFEEVKERIGLNDEYIANIRWTTTNLIFMWTADGTGSRGTGWTVSENR